MSFLLPIEPLPNQEFSLTLDSNRYDLKLKSSSTSVFVTVVRDEVTIVENIRAVGGTLILPYEYLEENSGNFIFTTPEEQLPFYENFGITQFLAYITPVELEALRSGAA